MVDFVEKTTWADNAGGGTPITAAELLRMERGIAAGGPGNLIDSAERTTLFDVQAVSTTATLVEGLVIEVPAQTRPWLMTFWSMAVLNTGTSVAGSLQTILVQFNDITAGGPGSTYAEARYTGIQPVTGNTASAGSPHPVANKSWQGAISNSKIMPPNTQTRRMAVYARTLVATITNWSAAYLYAGDTPAQDIYGPMSLTAVLL